MPNSWRAGSVAPVRLLAAASLCVLRRHETAKRAGIRRTATMLVDRRGFIRFWILDFGFRIHASHVLNFGIEASGFAGSSSQNPKSKIQNGFGSFYNSTTGTSFSRREGAGAGWAASARGQASQ